MSIIRTKKIFKKKYEKIQIDALFWKNTKQFLRLSSLAGIGSLKRAARAHSVDSSLLLSACGTLPMALFKGQLRTSVLCHSSGLPPSSSLTLKQQVQKSMCSITKGIP